MAVSLQAGEAPPEQRTFDEGLGQGGAVDGHERLPGAAAVHIKEQGVADSALVAAAQKLTLHGNAVEKGSMPGVQIADAELRTPRLRIRPWRAAREGWSRAPSSGPARPISFGFTWLSASELFPSLKTFFQ